MPKIQLENLRRSSVPSGIIRENEVSLTPGSILPFHGHFFIDETAFNTRDQALVRANKLTDGVIHGASYRTKDAKPKSITHYKAIALHFQNKTKFLEATLLHGPLPEGYVLPNGKGEAFLTWILDREYSAEEIAPALEKLKSMAAKHGVTLTVKIPWTKVCKQMEWVPAITLAEIENALRVMTGNTDTKPSGMAVEARNASEDASVAAEVGEGDFQAREVFGLEKTGANMEMDQEQNDTLRFIRTITPEGELIHVRSLGKNSDISAFPDNKFFSDPKEASLHTQALAEGKWDVYLATATFKDDSSGTQENFKSACSCPIDFDVATKVDAKHYGSKADALAGMQKVREKLFGHMDSPLVIVDSGNGIQAHVILKENVDVDVRKRLGTKIEKVCTALGEKPDDKVTKDAVRIMRVPGTFNYKGFKDGIVKPVICLEWNETSIAPSELESRLDELLGGDEQNPQLASSGMSRGGLSGAPGSGADDPVMKKLLGSEEPFVLAQNQTAITSLLEALNPDDEDHWRWALKLYKGCKQYAQATKDELIALWQQIMEWSRRSSAFESEQQQRAKMAKQDLCHPRGVFKHFQEPEKQGGIGWENPGSDKAEIKTDAGEPLHQAVAKVVAGLAREFSMDVDELAGEIRLKPDLINSVIEASAYNPTTQRYMFLTKQGELRFFKREHCFVGIVGTWGALYSIDAFEEIIKRSMEKPKQAEVTKKAQEIYTGLLNHIMVERQYNSISVKVDMFTDVASVRIREGVAALTFPHVKFAEGPIDEAVVSDYREHWGQVDRFLDLLAAARFAAARKKAYLWLKADSDWGKGVIEGVLSNLGLVVSTSAAEIEKVFTGGPVGRQLNDFKRSWVLLVNEFKSNKAVLKMLEQTISFAPKNQPVVSAELFLKLFTSAELVDSLGSEASGIEDQFANRFSMIKASGSIDSRPLFDASRKKYLDSLTNFFARELNRRVAEYQALGRDDAADKGDKTVNAFHREFGISKEYKRLSGKIEDMSRDFLDWILDEYLSAKDKQGLFGAGGALTKAEREVMERSIVVDEHGQKHLYVKQPAKLRGVWLEETFNQAERGKLLFKGEAFKLALPEAKKLHPTKTRRQVWAMPVGNLSNGCEGEGENQKMVA